MHLIHTRQAPSYLTDSHSNICSQRLRKTSIGHQSALRETEDEIPIRILSFLVHSSGLMDHLASVPSTDDEHWHF